MKDDLTHVGFSRIGIHRHVTDYMSLYVTDYMIYYASNQILHLYIIAFFYIFLFFGSLEIIILDVSIKKIDLLLLKV